MSGSHRAGAWVQRPVCPLQADSRPCWPLPATRTRQSLTVDRSLADGIAGTATTQGILGTLCFGVTVDTLWVLTGTGFRAHDLDCTKDRAKNEGLAVTLTSRASQKEAWRYG